jgi:hypothetical protein
VVPRKRASRQRHHQHRIHPPHARNARRCRMFRITHRRVEQPPRRHRWRRREPLRPFVRRSSFRRSPTRRSTSTT